MATRSVSGLLVNLALRPSEARTFEREAAEVFVLQIFQRRHALMYRRAALIATAPAVTPGRCHGHIAQRP
jgi:hypothetical protein